MGLFGRDLLSKAKPGIRIVNTARGGIVDEEALADAIRDGIVAGAGLDVFATEPCTESPLFELPGVVVSPHLGASTEEAQDKAGVTIAEQVLLALAGDFVPYAVNVAATDVTDVVRPFMGLAEQLGRFFVGLHDGLPDSIDMEYQGELAAESTGILTLSVLKGIFDGSTEEPVSYVNAPQLAAQRGLQVRESSTATSHDYKSLITLRSGTHSVAGTLITVGLRTEPRIVVVDDHLVEVPPSTHMIVVRNDDRPGVIGIVGTALGAAGVSISSMAVGPSPEASTAMMVISTTTAGTRRSRGAAARRRGDPRHPPRHALTRGSVLGLAGDGRPGVEAADDRFARGAAHAAARDRAARRGRPPRHRPPERPAAASRGGGASRPR